MDLNNEITSLANQMFVTIVLWMNSNCNIAKHGLNTCGRHNDFWVAFQLVGKLCDHAEGNLPVVTRNVKQCATRQLFLVHLDIRNSRTQSTTPIDESGTSIDDSLFMHPNESLVDSTDDFLNQLNSIVRLDGYRIHHEHSSIPIDTSTHFSQLVVDDEPFP